MMVTGRETTSRKGRIIQRLPAAGDMIARMTIREQEVMRLVVQGKSNKEVANTLALSPKTVEVHRAHVMEKMEVRSLADLIRAVLVIEPAK